MSEGYFYCGGLKRRRRGRFSAPSLSHTLSLQEANQRRKSGYRLTLLFNTTIARDCEGLTEGLFFFLPRASKKREPSPARRVALLMPSCLKYSPQSFRSRYASQEAWGEHLPRGAQHKVAIAEQSQDPWQTCDRL